MANGIWWSHTLMQDKNGKRENVDTLMCYGKPICAFRRDDSVSLQERSIRLSTGQILSTVFEQQRTISER